MMNYNYLEAMTEDVKEYLKNDSELSLDDLLYNRSDLEEKLHDDLWTCDSVTGNASGSYYCNAWKAEEALCHNWDLLEEITAEGGLDEKDYSRGPEWLDVAIRCWLLGAATNRAIDELEAEGKISYSANDEEE